MAKDGKKNKSAISESGVLSLDTAQHEQALKSKDWRGGGGTLLPVNQDGYEFTITAITRGESNGEKTKGAANYRLEAALDDPEFSEYAGTRANLFFIAHGNVAGRYLKFLEVAGGIDPEDLDPKAIPVPKQDEVDEWVGKRIKISVDSHSPDYKDATKTRADYSLVEAIGGGKKAGKKAKVGTIAK